METAAAPANPGNIVLTPAQVAQLELFREVTTLGAKGQTMLSRITNVRYRRFGKGDIIAEEGERGATAFFIVKGTVHLYVTPSPLAARNWVTRAWDRFTSWMEGVVRQRHLGTSQSRTLADQEFDAGGAAQARIDLPTSWVCLDKVLPIEKARYASTLEAGALWDELVPIQASKEKRTDALGQRLPGMFPRGTGALAAQECEILELDGPAILALREASPLKARLDEAMQKATAEARLGAGHPLAEEELRAVDVNGIRPFEGIAKLLADRPGCVVRRRYKAGDLICKQGEFGSTAYIIEQGTVQIYLESRAGKVKELAPPAAGEREFIPTDSGDLSRKKPIAELGAGDLFGEMTCMNFYPRAATAKALTDCVLLEILRNVLDQLKRSGPYKEKLDREYRERSLNTHLRAVPLFRELPNQAIEEIKSKATFVTFSRFDKDGKELPDSKHFTICREGDTADSFYLVRSGTIKVTQVAPGGELVLPYLSRGDYFGEIGLLLGGVRTASCSALDTVELVRIAKEDFELLLSRFPAVKAALIDVAQQRHASLVAAQAGAVQSNLKEFVAQGLMQAQDLLVIDLDSCVRCDACVQACASTHGGISRLPRDGLRFEHFLVTAACRSCRNPLCMIGCPVGSIRRRDSKEIIIEDWCIGCDRCANQCPYGSITMHYFRTDEPESKGDPFAGVKKQAAGCDLCSGYDEPNCVHACPHGSAMRVDPRKYFGGVAHRVAGRDSTWSKT